MQAIHSLRSLGFVRQGPHLSLVSAIKDSLFSFGITGNGPILPSIAIGGIRSKYSKKIQYKNVLKYNPDEGGIQYHKFVFFPRQPGHVDPPYEPTKLLMVRRIRSFKGKPYWEVDMLRNLKIISRRDIAIVKNTPEGNANLYKIKHLIEVKPITFKYGVPTDPKHGFLKENGEVISYNMLEPHQMELEEAEKEYSELLKKSVDGPTLKHRLRMNWFLRW